MQHSQHGRPANVPATLSHFHKDYKPLQHKVHTPASVDDTCQCGWGVVALSVAASLVAVVLYTIAIVWSIA